MMVRLTKTEKKAIAGALLKKLLDTEGEIRELKARAADLEKRLEKLEAARA